jgi:hypothetical protein
VRVEDRELTGSAGIDLSLERIDSYPDWQGAGYDSDDREATPAFWRNDKRLDVDWGADGPGSGLRRNDFSVRWTRQHDFVAGRYRFTVTAGDGVKLLRPLGPARRCDDLHGRPERQGGPAPRPTRLPRPGRPGRSGSAPAASRSGADRPAPLTGSRPQATMAAAPLLAARLTTRRPRRRSR